MSVKDRDGRDDHDDRSLTAKRLKRVNVEDPLSAFPSKTKTKLQLRLVSLVKISSEVTLS